MDNSKELALLKSNFKKVEDKHEAFFRDGAPRWPGETHDLLRNHHKSIDSLPFKSITLDHLAIIDLPDDIVTDLKNAFDAYKIGKRYQD